MKYIITARPIPESLAAFYVALTDGTIASQKPDGEEILASMQRAKVQDDARVTWYETCYCDTPLKHERETVYDKYFTDINTELVNEFPTLSGASFWNVLQRA